MAARLQMGVLLLLGVVLVGVGLERFPRDGDRPEQGGPVGWPREEEVDAPDALDEGWAEETEAGGERGALGSGQQGAAEGEDAASGPGGAAQEDVRLRRVRLREVWR